MNFFAKILLIIFIFAQSAPSIICLIDSDNDISINMIEDEEKSKEEKSKEEKELKSEFIFDNSSYACFFETKKFNEISDNYLIKDYKIYTSVNIMPPKV